MLTIEKLIDIIGRFHPLLVHLPIGLVFFWVVLVYLNYRNENKFLAVSKILLLVTFVTSFFACVAGYLLSLSGGYEEKLLSNHMWSAIAFTFIIGIAWISTITKHKFKASRILQPFVVIISIILLPLAGHFGGSLTHGEDYLSFSLKDENPKLIVLKANYKTAALYENGIQPIFNGKCISCHGASKKKADLRLDSYDNLMKGGEIGKVIIPGNTTSSELIKLIHLDPSEKRAMPPKGKIALTTEEIELIEFWVKSGAKQNLPLQTIELTENHKIALRDYVDGIEFPKGAEKEALPDAPAISEGKINELRNEGLVVNRLIENSNLVEVRVINNKDKWTDSKLNLLANIKDNILILDLSGTQITDQSLKSISTFSNLANLQVQKTALKNIVVLKSLKRLRTLNLYNTNVGDESIKTLSELPITKLYTWDSKITAKGIERLKSLNSKVEVADEDLTSIFLLKGKEKKI